MGNLLESNRREFIKTTSLLLAGAAVSPLVAVKAFAKTAAEGGVITAAHWGPMKAVIKDGKIVSSVSAIDLSIDVPMQNVIADQVYTKTRIKQPMIRKGFLDNLENVTMPDGKRGKDEFVPVSWDKAYDIIEQQLRRVRKDYAEEAIYGGSYGWRSAGVFHKSYTLMQRFFNLTGGFVGGLGDYSTGASQVIMAHAMGTPEVYEQQTSWEVILKESKVIVLWGCNIYNSCQIGWSASDGQGREYLTKLKAKIKSGDIKVISIDPALTNTCKYLGADWLSVNPTTDVPLMLAISHEIIKNDWHDKKFLEKYCVGGEVVQDYIMGKGEDSLEKTPEWAEKICGVSADKIRELAKLFHENRTMFMSGWSMQRQHHGDQPHWTMLTLVSLLGLVGLPGGGMGLSYHYSNGGVPDRKAGILSNIGNTPSSGMGSSNADSVAKAAAWSIPVAHISETLLNPGEEYQFNGKTRKYPHIRLIWWCGGSPFHQHQDLNRFRKAWQNPEVVIVSDPYWTATAKHADIVLPATTSYERNDLTMTGDYSNMHIVPMKQLVDPQNDAKHDWDVFLELSKRFEVEKDYTEGRDEMGWLSHLYEQARKAAMKKRVPMPPFAKFWDKNEIFTNPVDKKALTWVRHGDFRKDPVLNPLGTPSGKIELFSKTVADMNYDDCKGHASWLPPVEYLGNATEKTPLQLVSPHPEMRLHSQLNQTSLRDKYAVADREPIWMNKKDAEARGIKDGDLVRVFNGRGQILAGAVVNNRVKEKVLFIHEGAWYDPADGSDNALDKNGCANVLSIDTGTSQLSQGNCAQTALVNIEKYEGETPKLTAFEPPKGAA